MADEHAQPAKEELKPHGDALDKAVKSSGGAKDSTKDQPAPSSKDKE